MNMYISHALQWLEVDTEKIKCIAPILKPAEPYGSSTTSYKEKLLNSYVNYADQKTVHHQIDELDKKNER